MSNCIEGVNFDVGQIVPIRAVKSQTDKLSLTLTEDNGTPTNLTSNSFSFTIHADETSAALYTVTGTIASNVVTFALTTPLAALTVGKYYYKVIRTYATSDTLRIIHGNFKVVF
jgi:hypothetical protein